MIDYLNINHTKLH